MTALDDIVSKKYSDDFCFIAMCEKLNVVKYYIHNFRV